MKKIFGLLLITILSLSLASCKDSESLSSTTKNNNSSSSVNGDDKFDGLDRNTTASLDIMMWAGDDTYHEDIGSMSWDASEIYGLNVAAIYAVAKEFKKEFPNISINLYAKKDDLNGGDLTWQQTIEQFREQHGKYPDLWATDNVVREISSGLVLDLSTFSDSYYYKKIIPSLLESSNVMGFQGALPAYSIPWGVYVNKQLAEDNNINVPDPDWTIDEYTRFTNSAKPADGYYGSLDTSMRMLREAVVEKQLVNGLPDGKFIDVTTDTFKDGIKLLQKQSEKSIYSLMGLGEISNEEWNALGGYSYQIFANGNLLTLDSDPWMMGFANGTGANRVTSTDWDIYPCPSFEEDDNFIGSVLDPLVMYNYYGEDGVASPVEEKKAKIAFAFAGYWLCDNDSWAARAAQQYTLDATGTLSSALNDSFPIVSGSDFDTQMADWYSTPNHEPFSDAKKFPGFATVVDYYNNNKIYSVSDKAYPLTYVDDSGNLIECLDYLSQYANPDYVGEVTIDDDAWTNTYLAGLSIYNDSMNESFTAAFAKVKADLIKYYGWTEADFK